MSWPEEFIIYFRRHKRPGIGSKIIAEFDHFNNISDCTRISLKEIPYAFQAVYREACSH